MFTNLIGKFRRSDKHEKQDEENNLNQSSASPPIASDRNVPLTVPGDRVANRKNDHLTPQNSTDASAVSAPTTSDPIKEEDLRFYQGGVRQKHKTFVKWIGRIGFIAKGIVYGCIGVLTITNVTGAWTPNGSEGNESPQGAFLLLGGIPSIGRSILIVMAVGLVLYIIWRMWEAITGQGSDASFGKKKNFFRYRLSPFVSGLVYTAYAYYVIQMIFQTSEEQQHAASSSTFPASWTKTTLGKAGIGILGVAFLIAFTTQIINAVTGNFIKDLKTSEPGTNKYLAFGLHTLGRIGFGGRAALFATMSGFFWDSLAEANESGDKNMVAAAIGKLANSGGGRFFMVILGLSLVIYALFAVLNAYFKYFPTPPPTRQEFYTHDVVDPDESTASSSSSVSSNSEAAQGTSPKFATHKDENAPSTATEVKEAYETKSPWYARFMRSPSRTAREVDPEKQ
ncbi:unnamed protein product [Mucor circinelloides]|uniref:DUF1206 domain-containing protein n=1 Tax=Mucor circinelloides f. circinelloides (strain 1006PhL) TaxID=1220926 RepID=S2ITY5_MUCC1|nr:hypothetical protein HMPREF1544_12201 [Mucor circinelloides 1006PhL]